MLIQPNKILPHRPLPLLHHIPLSNILKPPPQPPNRLHVKLILMRLQIPQLREVLLAPVQLARVRLRGRVHDLVGPYVAVLRERLAADVARVGSLARVPAFVRFEVAELAEALTAQRFGAEEGLDACVHAGVDVEVGFLAEGFGAAWGGAFVLLF